MFVIGGSQPGIVRTFVLDYIQRNINDSVERPLSIIIRKTHSNQNNCSFGYYRPLAASRLKKMVFKYLDSLDSVVTFMTALSCGVVDYKVDTIVIQDLQEYIGGGLQDNLVEATSQLILLFTTMGLLSKVLPNKNKEFGSLGVTACGNPEFLQTLSIISGRFQKDYLSIHKENDLYRLSKNNQVYNSKACSTFFRQVEQFLDKQIQKP